MTDDNAQRRQPDNSTVKTVDMSPDAVWARLRLVDELNDLCRWLSEFKATQSGSEADGQNRA